jgi:hypothetical protein
MLQQNVGQMANHYAQYVSPDVSWLEPEDADLFGVEIYGSAAEADTKEKKAPFKLLSDLFKRKPGEEQSDAEKIVRAAAVTTANVQQLQQQPGYLSPPAPVSSWTPGKTAAVAVGSVAVLSLLGFGIYKLTR